MVPSKEMMEQAIEGHLSQLELLIEECRHEIALGRCSCKFWSAAGRDMSSIEKGFDLSQRRIGMVYGRND